ncbi:MAG: ATP-binding protein [Acidobacteriota bacterium]|nr:ATP-binding protein [Acidobacteriota bacterium]
MAWNNKKAKPENKAIGKETFFVLSPRRRLAVSVIIAISIVLVTALHFLTPVDQVLWHEIYQRLYYIPIISAALLFGLRGGLAASIFTTVVYSPHIYLHWQHGHFDYSINQYAEIVIFNVVGGVMGTLGDRLKRARERAERNAAERQKAYEELQKTFEQLLQAEKLSSLGELSAGIVHEVRNPLASIKGAVEILEDELKPDSPRREFADLAKKEIARLDKLVGEFLRFARPGALSVEKNDLNKIVESVASLIENQAAAQRISVEKNLQKNLPEVSVDAEQIKQVLLNLAINSLQAMAHSNGNGGALKFRTFEKENFCVIEVSDTGDGIDEKNLTKIFDPFFTTKEKGVGLGLSIAHKIIAQHEGKLLAENTPQGAVFKLILNKG